MGPKRTLGGATRPKDSKILSTARGPTPNLGRALHFADIFRRNGEERLFIDMVGALSRGGFRATIRTVTPVFANDTHVRINLSMWAIHLTWARANGAPMAPQPAPLCPLRAHPPEATASVCATFEVEIGRAGPRALVSANQRE